MQIIKWLSHNSTLTSVGLTDENLVEKVYSKTLELRLENGTKRQVREYKSVRCKKQYYIWDHKNNEFSKLAGLDTNILCSDLNSTYNDGLSQEQQFLRYIYFKFSNGCK